MANSSDLLLVLRFAAKELTETERASFKARLDFDLKLATQLKRVKSIYTARSERDVSQFALEPVTDFECAELIASFVEGTLTGKELSKFVDRCEESNELMAEVVEAFLFHSKETRLKARGSIVADGRFSDQMLKLLSAELKLGLESERAEFQIRIQTLPTDDGTKVSRAHPDSFVSAEGLRLEKQLVIWKTLAAVAAGIAVLAIAFTARPWQTKKPDVPSIANKEGPRTNKRAKDELVSRPKEGNSAPAQLPKMEQPTTDDRPLKESNGDSEKRSTDFNESTHVDDRLAEQPKIEVQPERAPRNSPSNILSTRTRLVQVAWEEDYRGVIGARYRQVKDSTNWVGIRNQDAARCNEFISLGDSWASCDISDVGKLILPGQSSVRILKKMDSDVVQIYLMSGSIALTKIPKGSRVFISTTPGPYNGVTLTGEAEESRVLISRESQSNYSTTVLSGRMHVERIKTSAARENSPSRILSREQHVLRERMRCDWSMTSVVREIAVREVPSWIRTPKRSQPLPARLLRQLNESESLAKTFDSLQQKKNEEFVIASTLSLQPRRIWKLLDSNEKSHRELAADWLFNQSAGSNQAFLAASELREQGVPFEISSAIHFGIHKRDRWAYEEALTMVRQLNHPVMANRQLSCSVMAKVVEDFPLQYRYSVDASPQRRKTAINKLIRSIDAMAGQPGSRIQAPSQSGTDSRSRSQNSTKN